MEIPTEVDLKVGETYTLRLPGLETAGYLWTHELVGNAGLLDVAARIVTGLQSGVGEQSTSIGSNKDEIFTVRALKAGHATIRFTQKRHWERNQPPLKEYMLEVDVKD